MELQLSKASLNNQIVTMRHIVRKSKVYTINKLLREANKLKEKKGNEEQILKNKKKAERFVNELLVIKKLNNDVVSKYALQNEVPTATILNYTDITLETRALARLAGHKFIVDAVQSFRIKYPDWKSCLIDLLSVLGTKFRVKKKSKQQKSIKVKAKCLKKNDRTIETTEFENAQSECDIESKIFKTNSDESNISLQNTKIEISHINTMLPIENDISMDKDKNIEFKPINSNIIIAKEKNHSDINVKPSHTEKINVFEIQTPTLKSQTPDKNSNSLTNLQINMIEDIKFDKSPKKKHKQSVSIKVDYNNKRKMSDEIKPICETVDSFFMTTDDKDYMSVYKPPAVVERSFEKPPKPEYQKPRKDVFIKGKKVVSSKQNTFGNRRERRQQQVEEPIDTSLHPSWEAKRKQKSLAKFEGKKITFDDQD